MNRVLVVGALGQVGSELIIELRQRLGDENVLGVDVRPLPDDQRHYGPFIQGDATDKAFLKETLIEYKINTVYHLAGILSAVGEKDPDNAWIVNMNSLKIVLDLAKDIGLKRVFWPSSISAFGPSSPRNNTPQATIMDPTTIYGITKFSGELLCNYYYNKYRVDVRSLRYPGLISYVTPPGGGTTADRHSSTTTARRSHLR